MDQMGYHPENGGKQFEWQEGQAGTVERRHIDLRGWTDGLNQAETHLHWTGFLISSSLGSSLKAVGSPLS